MQRGKEVKKIVELIRSDLLIKKKIKIHHE